MTYRDASEYDVCGSTQERVGVTSLVDMYAPRGGGSEAARGITSLSHWFGVYVRKLFCCDAYCRLAWSISNVFAGCMQEHGAVLLQGV